MVIFAMTDSGSKSFLISQDGVSPPYRRLAFAGTLFFLALLLYGWHLDGGCLSDDYLFVTLAEKGIGQLLTQTTIASNPQTIRPLPALLWMLHASPAGAAAHHAISIFIHAVNGFLIALLVHSWTRRPELGLLLGALFIAFPLFTEPVIWLSAAPDLLACCFTLLTLLLGFHDRAWAPWAAGLCFVLALACKETPLLAPIVLLVLVVPDKSRARRLAMTLGGVALAYLGLRFVLFHGLGGYLVDGKSVAHRFDVVFFIRNAFLQVPYRVLVGVKRSGCFEPWFFGLSAVLVLALGVCAKLWQKPQGVVRATVAYVIALLPVAPVLSIEPDHGGSRMLYFPVAMLAIALGALMDERTPRLRGFMVTLLVGWSLATVHNGRSWWQASREVQQTLKAMARHERVIPARSTVFVAGHDTWQGSFAWRNALKAAARYHGMRNDLDWQLGTASLLEHPEAALGNSAFEIGLLPSGMGVDWTPCQLALLRSRQPAMASIKLSEVQPMITPVLSTGQLLINPIPIPVPPGTPALAVRFYTAAPHPERGSARLYWRYQRWDRFTTSESRFLIVPSGNSKVIVRLPPLSQRRVSIQLLLESPNLEWLSRFKRVEIVVAPEVCAPNIVKWEE